MINRAGPGALGADGLLGIVAGEYGQVDGQAILNLFQHLTTIRDIMTHFFYTNYCRVFGYILQQRDRLL